MLEQGDSMPATEQMRGDCELECCSKPLEEIPKVTKSADKQDEGTHVFHWKHRTIARRVAAGYRPTSQHACEGFVGILDYPPDESLPTKHPRKEIDVVKKEPEALNESWPKLCGSADAESPTILGQNPIQRKLETVHARQYKQEDPGIVRRAKMAKEASGSCWAFQNAHQLRILTERRPQSLIPLSCSGELEFVEFMLDSAATATVITPKDVGKANAIRPGDASRAGVTPEVANWEDIPNL